MRWLKRLFSSDSKSRRKEQQSRPSLDDAYAPKQALPHGAERLTPMMPAVRQIVVGLDFGTSGTKVIVRDLWSNRAEPLILSQDASAGSKFILPSSISIENGYVYFGEAAEERRRSGQLFRGFKMCLACQLSLNSCGTSSCPNGAISGGCFHALAESEKYHISATDLVLWYLAYVQGKTAKHLEDRYGESARLKVWTNVGAPIDQESQPAAKDVFTRVAYLSQRLSSVVKDGIPLKELMDAQADLESKRLIVPEESERTIFVQPETATGLMAFVKSVDAAPGLYAIVDVGAGTTDVSFFRLSIPAGAWPSQSAASDTSGEKMAFYEAKTQMVGSTKIDQRVANLLNARHPASHDVLEHARKIKESFGSRGAIAGQPIVTEPEFIAAASPVIEEIFDVYRHTNSAAFKKEPIQSRWRDFRVFLLGGGTKLSILQTKFRNSKPSHVNRRVRVETVACPDDLKLSEKGHFRLLAVAYGLSFAPVEFPKIFRPHEVEPLEKSAAVVTRPDRDELYPK